MGWAMTDWVRLWHDMPTDPKWRVIARKSGATISEVIAVFNFVMVNASANASERGRTHNLFAEDIAAALDADEAMIDGILAAMKGKVICPDGSLLGWQKRQPKREDSSAERAKKWREERKRTQENANERPETETEEDNTLAKANADSDKIFWEAAKAYLSGESKNPGALIGKWVRDHGKSDTASAITRAQLERPVGKIPFIQGCLRQKSTEPVWDGMP